MLEMPDAAEAPGVAERFVFVVSAAASSQRWFASAFFVCCLFVALNRLIVAYYFAAQDFAFAEHSHDNLREPDWLRPENARG